MNEDFDPTSQAEQIPSRDGDSQQAWTAEERQQIQDLLRALAIMVGLISLVMLVLAVAQGWI